MKVNPNCKTCNGTGTMPNDGMQQHTQACIECSKDDFKDLIRNYKNVLDFERKVLKNKNKKYKNQPLANMKKDL